MTKPLVWICTPLRDHFRKIEDLDAEYREPIFALMEDKSLPYRFELMISPGGGIARARNKLAADFLKGQGTYMFCVDYDLCPTKENYLQILNRNLCLCGGIYSTREEKGHWVLNPLAGPVPDKTGLWQICELGTGFKCFHREGLIKIIEKHKWLEYEADDRHGEREWGFFSMGVVDCGGKRRWLTEDYWLDSIYRDLGIPIWADTSVKIKHRHRMPGETGFKYFPINDPELKLLKIVDHLHG